MNQRTAFAILLGLFTLLAVGWGVWQAWTIDLVDYAPEPVFRGRVITLAILLRTGALVPVVVAAATIVTVSVAVTPYDLGAGLLIARTRPIVIALIALGALNAGWVAYLGPVVHSRADHLSRLSATLRSARAATAEALDLDRLEEAERQLAVWRAIAPDDPDAALAASRLQESEAERAEMRRSAEALPQGAVSAPDRAIDLAEESAVELLARAREALRDEDFFSAYYYSGLIEFDDPLRRQALEIRNDARRAIENQAREIRVADEREYFADKRRALDLLERGETDPAALVESFYLFQELRERRARDPQAPADPDVATYLERARALIAEYTFFIDDAARFQTYPGSGPLFFVNRASSDVVELVSIDTLVSAESGDYGYGVEVMRLTREEDRLLPPELRPALHLRSRYAMIINGMLVMRAIARTGSSEAIGESVQAPVYFVGEGDSSIGTALVLSYAPAELTRFAGGADRFDSLSLGALMSVPAFLRSAAASTTPAWRALATRLVRIAGFFVTVFAALAIGWRYRSRYLARPPLPSLLVIPFVPLVLRALLIPIRGVTSAAIVTLIPEGAGAAALIWVVVALVAAIVLSVTAVAVQRVEP